MHQTGRVALSALCGLVLQAAVSAAAPGDGAQPALAGAYARGMADVQAGRFQDAIAEFDAAIHQDPASAAAYDSRGSAYESLHQARRAFSDYDQAVALKPDFASALLHRGHANSILGRPKAALADFDQALKLTPGDPADALIGRGSAYHDLGQYDLALADLSLAARLKPGDARAFDGLGRVHHALGQDDKAFDDLDQAIKLKPDFAQAVSDRGTIYVQRGDNQRALEYYDQALKLNPDLEVAYFDRGNAYRNLGRFGEAIESFTKAIAVQPNYSMAYNNRGAVYRLLRQFPAAMADYDAAIRINPGYALAIENRAGLFSLMKQPDKATAGYSQASDAYAALAREQPQDPALQLKRASTAQAAGRWADAIAAYTDYLALKPVPPLTDQQRANAYLQRGWSHNGVAELDAALADIETALRLQSDIDQGKFRHAILLRALGRYQEAMSEFDDVISRTEAVVYYGRAVTYFCLGRYDDAESDWLHYLQLRKNETSVYDWLHIIHAKRGTPDDDGYKNLKSPYAAGNWMSQISELYRGRQTIQQAEAARDTSRAYPTQNGNWPCSSSFFLGEYKLEHGDLAGARADFAAIPPAKCDYAEAAAAAAELKRLPAN